MELVSTTLHLNVVHFASLAFIAGENLMVLPSKALFLISRNRAFVIYRRHRCSYGRFVMFVSYKKVYTALMQ